MARAGRPGWHGIRLKRGEGREARGRGRTVSPPPPPPRPYSNRSSAHGGEPDDRGDGGAAPDDGGDRDEDVALALDLDRADLRDPFGAGHPDHALVAERDQGQDEQQDAEDDGGFHGGLLRLGAAGRRPGK